MEVEEEKGVNESGELRLLSVPFSEPGLMEHVIDCDDLDRMLGVPAKCASILDVHSALDEACLDDVVIQVEDVEVEVRCGS